MSEFDSSAALTKGRAQELAALISSGDESSPRHLRDLTPIIGQSWISHCSSERLVHGRPDGAG